MPFVEDTFTDTPGTNLTAHTPETGGPWTGHPSYTGTGVITDANRLRDSAGSFGAYAAGAPASAEYDVEADHYVASNSGSSCNLCGRMSTSANTMYLDQYHSSGQWRLYRAVNGVFTQLGSYSQALSVGVTYARKLELRDAAKKFYVDGVERISSADNTITAAGKAGLRGGDPVLNTTGHHLDNFTASDPASAVVELVGTVAATGLAAAALLVSRRLLQASAGSAGAAGAISVSRLLAEAATGLGAATATATVSRWFAAGLSGESAASAFFSVARLMVAAAAGAGAADGGLELLRLCSGSAPGEAAGSGSLTLSRQLGATSAGLGVTAADLALARLLSASPSGAGVAEGALSILGATLLLAGLAAGSGSVSSALHVDRRLAAELLASAVVAGDLRVTRALAAMAVGSGELSGTLITELVAALICWGGTVNWRELYGGTVAQSESYGGSVAQQTTYGGSVEMCNG